MAIEQRVRKLEDCSSLQGPHITMLIDFDNEGDDVLIERYCKDPGCQRQDRQFVIVVFVKPDHEGPEVAHGDQT